MEVVCLILDFDIPTSSFIFIANNFFIILVLQENAIPAIVYIVKIPHKATIIITMQISIYIAKSASYLYNIP